MNVVVDPTLGGDLWLRQSVLKLDGHILGIYQGAISHCCGMATLAKLFPYASQIEMSPSVVVQKLVSFLKNLKEKDIGVYPPESFTPNEVIWTDSEDLNDNQFVQELKKYSVLRYTFVNNNYNDHVVSVYAINLSEGEGDEVSTDSDN